MRRVSVRELQQNLRRILDGVARGETVEITRRHRVLARLTPVVTTGGEASRWPDLEARARDVLGDKVLSPGAMEQVLSDRGNW